MFFDVLNRLFLSYALKLGLVKDDPVIANFKITKFSLNPPSPSTILAGQDVTAEIEYESNLKTKSVQIWVVPTTESIDYHYQGSPLESAKGKLTRSFEATSDGHFDQIAIIVQHFSGKQLLVEKIAVDYEVIPNFERDLLKNDGIGSSVEIKEVYVGHKAIQPYAKVKTSDSVDVVINYKSLCEHEAYLWAIPTTEASVNGSYSSGELESPDEATIIKSFSLKEPCMTTGIHVRMVNIADETIAEQWLDFPIEIINK